MVRMNFGRPRREIAILLFHCLLAANAFCLASLQEKPNVLVIMVDDLNDCIDGMGGHPQALTPHMTRLAQSGVSFRRAYTNAPMCGPSRSSMFTGVYPHNSNNYFQAPWFKNGVLSNTRTLMEQFKSAGYQVLGSGKVMHQNKEDMWTSFENPADYGPSPFDGKEQLPHPDVPAPFSDLGWVDGSLGPFVDLTGRTTPGGRALNWTTGNDRIGYTPMRYINDEDRDPTPDERNAAWAAQTIRSLSASQLERPFFLAVGFLRPHTPLVAPQKYFDRFPLDQLKLAVIRPGDADDTYLEVAYRGGDTHALRLGEEMFEAISAAYGSTDAGLKKWTQAYLACVAAVDDNIGMVLDALDRSPLRSNTIVVLTSDHGFHMGEKDYLYKNSLWEESTRVPLLLRAPGLTRPGSRVEHPVSLIDIYPTLVDLCGLSTRTAKNEKGHSLDGFSMRPLLENPASRTWNRPAVLTVVFAGEAYKDDPTMQHYAIRTERYRYILYNTGDEELYDHESDPYEWHNLAGLQTEPLKKMRRLLQEMVSPHKLAAFKRLR